MDLIRSIVLANVWLLVLVNVAAVHYRRCKIKVAPTSSHPERKTFARCPPKFGRDYGPGFRKRNDDFSGFGERTQILQTGHVQEPEKNEKFYLEKEQQKPYLNTDSGSLPDWKATTNYFYPDYLPMSQRNMEQVQRYGHPENGYIPSNSRIWGKNTGLYNGPENAMSKSRGRQNPTSDGPMELALLLKKLFSSRDKESYSDLQ